MICGLNRDCMLAAGHSGPCWGNTPDMNALAGNACTIAGTPKLAGSTASHAVRGERRIPERWHVGTVAGVEWSLLSKLVDERGWLMELFRDDELPEGFRPAMAYVSQTKPGIVRGPHEHLDQTDYFCFMGPACFEIYLWDIRVDSPTYGMRQVLIGGERDQLSVIVPPGVVHAYKNIDRLKFGLVFNAPNRLFKGRGRAEAADEIRHEGDARFQMEEERRSSLSCSMELCADTESGETIVVCECGKLRPSDKPHGFRKVR